VAFGLNSMDSLCERLTSKEALPLHKWTHVALVSEGAKLRLYLNGALDSPRNHTGMSTQRGYLAKHPLYVGKVRLQFFFGAGGGGGTLFSLLLELSYSRRLVLSCVNSISVVFI